MSLVKEINELQISLTRLTNEEWYYIISDLLGLGSLGSGLIEREKLFISIDRRLPNEIAGIKFFFISQALVIPDRCVEVETKISLGSIAQGFDDVRCTYFKKKSPHFKLEHGSFIAAEMGKTLSEAKTPPMRPLKLVKELIKIASQTDYVNRESNALFRLEESSELKSELKQELNFGRVNGVDYSGNYFLIARPILKGGINSVEAIRPSAVEEEFQNRL